MPQALPADQPASLAILMIEDNEDDALLLLRRFHRAGYRVRSERLCTASALARALQADEWDIIICDHSMPCFDALAALEIIKAGNLDVPFIIVSGHINEDTAVSAMRAGAHDYLNKNNLERLLPAVERELREARNRRERRQALPRCRRARRGCVPWPPARPASFSRCAVVRHADCASPMPAKPARCCSG